jgi:hypothetical protein
MSSGVSQQIKAMTKTTLNVDHRSVSVVNLCVSAIKDNGSPVAFQTITRQLLNINFPHSGAAWLLADLGKRRCTQIISWKQCFRHCGSPATRARLAQKGTT